MPKVYTITEDQSDQRIDKYLRKLLPSVALGDIFKMIRKKQITLNGKKTKQNIRLTEWDQIKIFLPDDKIHSGTQKTHNTPRVAGNLEPERIVYEDDQLLIYNKPSGLICHPSDYQDDGGSLIQLVWKYLEWKQDLDPTFRASLAHRIDKETSGIIIICKTRKSLMHMMEKFKNRTIKKTYHALVHWVPPQSWVITEKLLRTEQENKNKPKVLVDQDGLSAKSHFKLLETFKIPHPHGSTDQEVSLVEVSPHTGRMHQIRVHMSHIGHPLVGDTRYGGKRIIFPTSSEELSSVLQKLQKRKFYLQAQEIEFDEKKVKIDS